MALYQLARAHMRLDTSSVKVYAFPDAQAHRYSSYRRGGYLVTYTGLLDSHIVHEAILVEPTDSTYLFHPDYREAEFERVYHVF